VREPQRPEQGWVGKGGEGLPNARGDRDGETRVPGRGGRVWEGGRMGKTTATWRNAWYSTRNRRGEGGGRGSVHKRKKASLEPTTSRGAKRSLKKPWGKEGMVDKGSWRAKKKSAGRVG